jgi:hypothetical protein
MKLRSALFLCLALAAAGCGVKTYPITGSVKMDGEPIPEGHIAFVSEELGAGGNGPITDGHYNVAVPHGKVKIQITASKMQKLPAGQKGMYGKTEELRAYIPAKYNAATELKEEITGPKELNFDLKSK